MRGERTLALFVLAALLTAGVAGAHADDERPHVQAFQEPRRVLVSGDGGHVDVQLLLNQRALTDALRIEFDGSTGLLRYEHRVDTAQPVPGFRLEYRIESVVEYGDENGNQRFEPGLDLVYRTRPLKSMTWDTLENQTVRASIEGSKNARFTEGQLTSAVGRFGANGTLTFEFYAFGGPVVFDGRPLHAQDVAVHLHLDGWVYQNPESRLAIVGEVWSPRDATVRTELGTDDVLRGLVLHRPNEHMAFVEWDEKSHQDGRERLTQASVGHTGEPEGEGYARPLTLNYPHGESIHHALVLGVEYAPREAPAYLGVHPWIVHGGLGGALLVGLASIARSERRKHERRVDFALLARRTPPDANWIVRASDAVLAAARKLRERLRDRGNERGFRPSARDP